MGATQFDGLTQYATRNTDCVDGNADNTVAFWFFASSTTDNQQVLGLQAGSAFSGSEEFTDIRNSGSGTYLRCSSYTTYAGAATNGAVFQDNEWHHLARVRNGTSLDWYLDGDSTAYASITHDASGRAAIDDMWIAHYEGSPNGNIRLRSMKWWTAVLTIGEIQREMFQDSPIRRSNLYGWWHWLNGDGNDYSGNGRNWTLTGSPTAADGPRISYLAPRSKVRIPTATAAPATFFGCIGAGAVGRLTA